MKWCHFQWPWTNPNPVFKVTSFFDAEYLRNDYRYGHSYYGRRIGNRTQAFKWYHFQWPWVTANSHFKVTIILNTKQLDYVWSIQWFRFQWLWVTLNLEFKVTVWLGLNALDVLCARLTRDLFAIAKFLFTSVSTINKMKVFPVCFARRKVITRKASTLRSRD